MPINNNQRTTSNRDGSRTLTDQELLSPVWVGKTTGNLFKAVKVELVDGIKHVTYKKSSGDSFTKPYDVFIARFRPATTDDLWNSITTLAPKDDGENISNLVSVVEPDFRHDLDRMILYPECREEIRIGLNRIIRAQEMEEHWALSQIEPSTNRCIMNYYGAPGTGKSLAAVAVANMLGKKLLKVDYSEIVSKYVGDTAKHIKAVFKIAKESNAALMFDEADALLSSRLGFGDSSDGAAVTSINQNRSTLLLEVDNFNGLVIMCTNFFGNYDEAFLRRIARHVEFKLPNVEMRKALFKLHLPKQDRVVMCDSDWDEVANTSDEFSGGDILNAVVNGITRASMGDNAAEWQLTADHVLAEIDSIKRAKQNHGGSK